MAHSHAKHLSQVIRTGLVLAAAGALAGCDAGAANETPPKPQAVETLTVSLQPASRAWSYVGTIKARYQSDLGFRVGGKVVARLVEVGEHVERGQVLSRLDPADLELALASQEAELAAATASRDEAVASLARYDTLFKDGHVSKAALDQRGSAAAEARARVDRGQRNVSLARNQLNYATLFSDATGVVTTLPVEAGQVVAAGQLVAKVARLDAIEAEVALPEQDVEAIRGAKANVVIWGASPDDEQKSLTARLREVAPDADPMSRTFRARFALDAPGPDATLGRTATVRLRAGQSDNVAVLPISAVVNEGRGAVVWVVSADGTRAAPRPVTIHSLENGRVLVSSGLSNGDQVVVLGVHLLDPGKPIRSIASRTATSQN